MSDLETKLREIEKLLKSSKYSDAYRKICDGIATEKVNGDQDKVDTFVSLAKAATLLLADEHASPEYLGKLDDGKYECSFCQKKHEKKFVMVSERATICRECTVLAVDILDKLNE